METVAFYSYKGGIGRSSLLANAACFLASHGKGVVALDFDFEAPGLHYKLAGGDTGTGGAVPYLLATVEGTGALPLLDEHTIRIEVPGSASGWLRLMPAGPAPQQRYWSALKQLGERLRLDDLSGRGLLALLDLQVRIAEELAPDYLLIDTHTGVTDFGGMATSILADTLVCLFAANQESLDGTLAVVEAINAAPRLEGQNPIRVLPIARMAPRPLRQLDRYLQGLAKLMQLGVLSETFSREERRPFELPFDDFDASADPEAHGAYRKLFGVLFPSVAAL